MHSFIPLDDSNCKAPEMFRDNIHWNEEAVEKVCMRFTHRCI